MTPRFSTSDLDFGDDATCFANSIFGGRAMIPCGQANFLALINGNSGSVSTRESSLASTGPVSAFCFSGSTCLGLGSPQFHFLELRGLPSCHFEEPCVCPGTQPHCLPLGDALRATGCLAGVLGGSGTQCFSSEKHLYVPARFAELFALLSPGIRSVRTGTTMISFIWHFLLVPNASNVSVEIFEVDSGFF